MHPFVKWLTQHLIISDILGWKILASVIVMALVLLLRPLVMALVHRRTADVGLLYRWRKVVEYTGFAIILFLLSRIWFVGSASLVTYLGLLSAGLAIALQDPIGNLFGWLLIMGRRPFDVGDRIQIGPDAGDVVDVRFFHFSILEIGNWVDADQSTGRVLHIPNKRVFSETIANYTTGIQFIWNEIPVTVTFDSDWRQGKAILHEIAARRTVLETTARERVREAARRYMINYDKLTPIVYTAVADNGIVLTIRYLCDPRQRRSTEQLIWEDILDAFAQNPHLAFAYPTQQIYYNGQHIHSSRRPPQAEHLGAGGNSVE